MFEQNIYKTLLTKRVQTDTSCSCFGGETNQQPEVQKIRPENTTLDSKLTLDYKVNL